MESKMMRIFAMLMLFSLCSRANAEFRECALSDLHVTQTATGKNDGGNTEYTVEVENKCICTQTDVKLLAPGFKSSEPVDPNVFRPDADGKLGTLNNGSPVYYGNKIKFNYTSTTKFSLAPFSSSVACS
ncbi:hypothetical protein CFC21_039628 [Triticum aestivum]|uniref:Uncharacterized protein n=2 Tax=Triticum aestivum TaxID=4565 RepID=A0A9R1JS21_WHEAT|nr:hypothetical protein CFC21_039619 [Triticum aestivum]KAF7027592.1 hypothetical protein CFC21_039622 [Triticum aestivum]KAF7027595.1 hypothetical protein CFC21_039626 [Triticum aestivum]KAF7027597.1 hypothetical protein CFC21_039628 [Triticum aestivum]CDJ26657.1 unnamed protein product [Triticum aestivum]